jgi:hypothetical protein
MGQYFKAINLDKREVVCPWCLDGGAKLWEWAVNRQGAVFTLLLRQSSSTGGGDYGGPEPQLIELTNDNAAETLNELMAKGLAREGMEMAIGWHWAATMTTQVSIKKLGDSRTSARNWSKSGTDSLVTTRDFN